MAQARPIIYFAFESILAKFALFKILFIAKYSFYDQKNQHFQIVVARVESGAQLSVAHSRRRNAVDFARERP